MPVAPVPPPARIPLCLRGVTFAAMHIFLAPFIGLPPAAQEA